MPRSGRSPGTCGSTGRDDRDTAIRDTGIPIMYKDMVQVKW